MLSSDSQTPKKLPVELAVLAIPYVAKFLGLDSEPMYEFTDKNIQK